MDKVYIVTHEWNYSGEADDFGNTYTSSIKKIVSSEEKAIAFIQDVLRPLVKKRKAVLAVKATIDRAECVHEKCMTCIACDDVIDLDEVPTFEYIKEHNKDEYGIVYSEENHETSSYRYQEYEVD